MVVEHHQARLLLGVVVPAFIQFTGLAIDRLWMNLYHLHLHKLAMVSHAFFVNQRYRRELSQTMS